VGLVARSKETLTTVSEGLLGVTAVPADTADEGGLRSALDQIVDELGVPEVVVYNAAIIQPDAIGDLTARQQLDAWAVNVVGAITTAAHVVPAMVRNGGGSFILTGGMPEAKAAYVSLSLGKAGVRTLVTLLDQQYGVSGVHAATVTVAGAVAPGTAFDPDDIAEHYWRLHNQPRDQWQHEIVYTGVD
jgi:NAD(P)-dependent dehydrogenase (short-subunit alcohol dehydrogenase family)